ncbi:hypothetical protein VP01_61g13, partial [Puccinia sorghi]
MRGSTFQQTPLEVEYSHLATNDEDNYHSNNDEAPEELNVGNTNGLILDLPPPFNFFGEITPHPAAHSQVASMIPNLSPHNEAVNHSMLQALLKLDPEKNSLANKIVEQWVSQLTQSNKTNCLPPGFSQKNPQAVKLVQQIVYDLINQSLAAFQLQQHLPRASEFTQELAIPTHVMVRFTYLHLATILFVHSGSNARGAAWGPIDCQLIFLRSQSEDYNLLWSKLILQKDQLVFGSGNHYYQKNQANTLTLPTKAEVQ